jgi:folate-dependent phosphoribosylglycinamide formyltransferase PurN
MESGMATPKALQKALDRLKSLPCGKAKIVVALSGGGRTLENLLQAQESYETFEVCGVITNRDCRGTLIASEAGLPIYTESFSGSKIASMALTTWLWDLKPDWIVLAGFIKIFPTTFPFPFPVPWQDNMINIHPALLPDYGGVSMYGHRVHSAVLEKGDIVSGASVHFINKEYDKGKIISQIKVPVYKEDNISTLERRVFDAECSLYPATIDGLVAGRLPLTEEVFEFENGLGG